MAGNHLSRVLYLQSNRGEVKIEKMGYVFLIRVQMIPSFSGCRYSIDLLTVTAMLLLSISEDGFRLTVHDQSDCNLCYGTVIL